MAPREPRRTRGDYRHFAPIPTRWADNDVYGHVNNVVYYAFFDTAVNRWLVDNGFLDIATGTVIGLVAETRCRYFESIAYPETIEVGLGVAHLGTSAITYDLAIFRQGQDAAAAQGHFVHVMVDRASQRPVPIPAPMRSALEALRLTPAPDAGSS